MTDLPKLPVHDAELVEADAANLYADMRTAEGADGADWLDWPALPDSVKALYRFVARRPYANLWSATHG